MTWQIWRFEGYAFPDFEDYRKAVWSALDRDLGGSGDLERRGLVPVERRDQRFTGCAQGNAATIPVPTPSIQLLAMATTWHECAVVIQKKKESNYYGNNQRGRKGRTWKAWRATQKLPLAKRSF